MNRKSQKLEFNLKDVNHYKERLKSLGYLHFNSFFTESEVQLILKELKDTEQKYLANRWKQVYGIPIVYGFDVDGAMIANRMPFVSLFNSNLKALAGKLLVLRAIFGDEFRVGEEENDGVVATHYLNTDNSLKQIGWHTDSMRDFFYFRKSQPFYNVGVYLTDSPKEKGGLRVLEGTHNQTLFQALFRKLYFIENAPDADEVCVEAHIGDLTIHDGRMWHRVAKSCYTGELSRRRIVYFPFISGKVNLKNDGSKTPPYFRILKIIHATLNSFFK
jgi:phytanoyl-CoA hydroxylase